MIYGIFTGHSNFALNAVESVEKIIGVQDNYSIVSNKELSSEDIFKTFQDILTENVKELHVFIFIDFYGSSISLPSMRIKQMYDSKVTLVFGYNMPMLLDFFIHRDKKNPLELQSKLIEVGRMGIR
ncbi:MAG: hypothetical protein COX48_02750 [bacterium (Candidatus Stahlbacteria) CG23_combo_of_CG06-09_8_20_14_all_34_7]|nr:MAG: hypothetical protein COX48_02750 [bacterium (Candidatus Stahlbacteria) CG23_combo_of_CG06-09_8_20_14_all_34_7]